MRFLVAILLRHNAIRDRNRECSAICNRRVEFHACCPHHLGEKGARDPVRKTMGARNSAINFASYLPTRKYDISIYINRRFYSPKLSLKILSKHSLKTANAGTIQSNAVLTELPSSTARSASTGSRVAPIEPMFRVLKRQREPVPEVTGLRRKLTSTSKMTVHNACQRS